jgi:nucleoid DNA-binding protein
MPRELNSHCKDLSVCLLIPADMTLTKREIVMKIATDTGLTQAEVFNVVQMTFDAITQTLAKNDRVELRDFGVFEAVVRKARVGRNPNNPEIDVLIPRRAMVKFKAGKTMREKVLKLPTKAKQTKTKQ